ncbi:hypothetical protein FA13DRAFT_1723875 [Coprinellus micaceus]|uniref:ABM domain-containing protein n=1 Tax=Coprinellus micaceus TaxID=71717 RepID=A0A4Y7TZN5_COPMI|nr:hypothetical protein FA13DRAFT_1723875 [Coprinellus micaceus]
MPITELAILSLSHPHTTLTPNLKETFLQATAAQAAWSSYPVYLFSESGPDPGDGQGASTVYLVSGWDSVDAHYEWIKSEENQRWMKELGQWLGEVQLRHLDFAFEKEGLDVACVVVEERVEAEEKAEGAGWSAVGKDLEDLESGYHQLTAYPDANALAALEEPAEGETRVVLKRIWSSDSNGDKGTV